MTASMRGCGARPRGRRAGGRVGRRSERGVEGRAGRRSERGVEGGAGRRAGPRQGSQSARGGQVWPGHVARPQRAPWSPALAIPWGGGRRRDTHHRVHGHPHAPGGRALRGRQVGLEGGRRHRGFRPRLLRHRGARGGGGGTAPPARGLGLLLGSPDASGRLHSARTTFVRVLERGQVARSQVAPRPKSKPQRGVVRLGRAALGPTSLGAGARQRGGAGGMGGEEEWLHEAVVSFLRGPCYCASPPARPWGAWGGAPGGHPLAEHWPDEHPPRPPDAHAQRRPSWDSLTTTAPSSTPRCAPPRPPPPRPPAPQRPRARALLGGGVWGVGKGGPNAAPAGQTDREDTA